MLDRIRHSDTVEYVRHALRGKLVRAIEDAIRPYHREQMAAVEEARHQLGELRMEVSQLRQEVRDSEHRSRRDIEAAAEREAAASTWELVRVEMPKAPTFKDMRATLDYGLSMAPEEGMALEFGVFTGGTLKLIATAREGKDVYGFDSFEGLPETWRSGFPTGTFDTDGLPDVSGAELVVGWFDDTLPGFLAEHPGPVAFLHVDCDLYSSTKTVLELVGPRLRPGSIVVFDEYFNYPSWQEHEYKAWMEYVQATGIEFSYEGYTVDHEQVIVRITKTPNATEVPDTDRA